MVDQLQSQYLLDLQQQMDAQRRLQGSANGSPFVKIRFDLSTAKSRGEESFNKYKSPFKSFWISDASDTSAIAYMFFNRDHRDEAQLKLQKNLSVRFPYQMAEASLEWPAQSGKWIEVCFSADSDLEGSLSELVISGGITVGEGDNFNHDNISISSIPSLIVEANNKRAVTTVFNQSSYTLYLGTNENLLHADYTKKCLKLYAGQSMQWKNKSGLFARTESATTDEVVIFNEVLI